MTESESDPKIAGEPVLGDTAEDRSQIAALIREDTDFLARHGYSPSQPWDVRWRRTKTKPSVLDPPIPRSVR